MITYEAGLAAELGDDVADTGATDLGPPVSFDPENIPEEAKLVEVLQVMNRRPMQPKRRLLAVMVSAWDVVGADAINPGDWLAANRPMLWQYITSNPDLWNVRAYGVSALGGRLPAQRQALLLVPEPSRRIKIVGPDATAHDLTAPMRWILGEMPLV